MKSLFTCLSLLSGACRFQQQLLDLAGHLLPMMGGAAVQVNENRAQIVFLAVAVALRDPKHLGDSLGQ